MSELSKRCLAMAPTGLDELPPTMAERLAGEVDAAEARIAELEAEVALHRKAAAVAAASNEHMAALSDPWGALGRARTERDEARAEVDRLRASLGKTRGMLYSWLFGYNSNEEVKILVADTETVLAQTSDSK